MRTKEQFIQFMKDNDAWEQYYAHIKKQVAKASSFVRENIYKTPEEYIDWMMECCGNDATNVLALTRPIKGTMAEEAFWMELQKKWSRWDGKPKPTRPLSQNSQILDYLASGHTLTALDALNRFGCFRLGARIADLRNEGHLIKTTMVTTKDGKRIAEYSLIMEAE